MNAMKLVRFCRPPKPPVNAFNDSRMIALQTIMPSDFIQL